MSKDIIVGVCSSIITAIILYTTASISGLLEKNIANTQIEEVAESLTTDEDKISILSEEISKRIGRKIASGDTGKGETKWEKDASNQQGIFVDVDTSDANFQSTPHYLASLHGDSYHWETTGGSEIYSPTRKGFRVYVRFSSDDKILTTRMAEDAKWHIVWHAIASK